VPSDPGQHPAYVGGWIKALHDEPLETFRGSGRRKDPEVDLGASRLSGSLAIARLLSPCLRSCHISGIRFADRTPKGSEYGACRIAAYSPKR